MTRLIGLTGRSGSGKSTLAKKLVAHYDAAGYHAERMAFAAPLKRLCVDVLGLTEEQVSGDGKDDLTDYLWQRLPHRDRLGRDCGAAAWSWDDHADNYGPSGRMTARQVMQQVGTDIFRWLDPDVWVKAAMRAVDNLEATVGLLHDSLEGVGDLLVVFDDLRFVNEAKAIADRGGFVVRLEGGGDKTHASEDVDAVPADLVVDSFALGVDKTTTKIVEYADSHFGATTCTPTA